MKNGLELLILRHGKSDWGAAYDGDHERPLNDRGRRAAGDVGRLLALSEETPERWISSTAVRARTTSELAIETGDLAVELETDARLYGASVEAVLAVVAERAGEARRVLVAGHEPTSSSLVAHLTGAHVRFPTAALACVALTSSSWQGVKSDGGELLYLVIPRLLRGGGADSVPV